MGVCFARAENKLTIKTNGHRTKFFSEIRIIRIIRELFRIFSELLNTDIWINSRVIVSWLNYSNS